MFANPSYHLRRPQTPFLSGSQTVFAEETLRHRILEAPSQDCFSPNVARRRSTSRKELQMPAHKSLSMAAGLNSSHQSSNTFCVQKAQFTTPKF